MMHRSGWASKEGQEHVLAIKISRRFFEELLDKATLSNFNQHVYQNEEKWKSQLNQTSIRVQWDPCYDLYDNREDFRAIQIGLKNEMVERYARHEIAQIIDITDFVHEQNTAAKYQDLQSLLLPEEKAYPLPTHLEKKLGII